VLVCFLKLLLSVKMSREDTAFLVLQCVCVEVVDYRRLCNTHVVIILLSCSLYFELPLDVRYFYSTVMFCYLLAVIDASIC